MSMHHWLSIPVKAFIREERFIRHRSALGQKTHGCAALQQDAHIFGVSDLEMRTLAQDFFMKPNDLLDAKK